MRFKEIEFKPNNSVILFSRKRMFLVPIYAGNGAAGFECDDFHESDHGQCADGRLLPHSSTFSGTTWAAGILGTHWLL
jgi:hypothetical protein